MQPANDVSLSCVIIQLLHTVQLANNASLSCVIVQVLETVQPASDASFTLCAGLLNMVQPSSSLSSVTTVKNTAFR